MFSRGARTAIDPPGWIRRRIADSGAQVSLLADAAKKARLQGWLRETLPLGGRVVFDSAVPAGHRFDRLMPPGDEARRLALRTAILQLCGRLS